MLLTGNVNNHIKLMEMKHKWNQKKEDPASLTPDIDEGTRSLLESMMPDKDANTLGNIETRLRTGKRLSAAEMEYLRVNNPELYARARRIEFERADYERRLRNCKTKDEVRALRMSAAAGFVDEVRSAGLAGDGEACMDTHDRSMAIGNEHTAFTETRRYWELPQNHAEREARRKQRGKAPLGVAGLTPRSEILLHNTARKQAARELYRKQLTAQPPARQREESAPVRQRKPSRRDY